jgi:hypothetical protein
MVRLHAPSLGVGYKSQHLGSGPPYGASQSVLYDGLQPSPGRESDRHGRVRWGYQALGRRQVCSSPSALGAAHSDAYMREALGSLTELHVMTRHTEIVVALYHYIEPREGQPRLVSSGEVDESVMVW